MIVKINGSVFDTERVMRFAPRRKGGLDFLPRMLCRSMSWRIRNSHCVKEWTNYPAPMSGRWTRWVGGFCYGATIAATRSRSVSLH